MSTSTIRMGKKCDQRDYDCGMIVGARQGGFSISEIADLLGFSRTTVSSSHPVSSSSAGRNALLMREVSGDGPHWSKLS